MVFRNLRERFGIDDQDYQVWRPECQLSLGYCISRSNDTPSASRPALASLWEPQRMLLACGG